MKYLFMLLLPLNLWAVGSTFLAYDSTLLASQEITTIPMKILNFSDVSMHAVYDKTAGISGTCVMQVSNDNVNFATVTNSSFSIAETSGNDFVNKPNIGAVWMRGNCNNDGAVNITGLKIYLGGK